MYKKGTGNDKQGKEAGNRTLCPYRNFSQAITALLESSAQIRKSYGLSTNFFLKFILSTSPRITFHEERVAGEGTKRAGGGLEKNKLKQRSIAIEAFWNDSKQYVEEI